MVVTTVLYFSAFIVQLAVWAPSHSFDINSNVSAGVYSMRRMILDIDTTLTWIFFYLAPDFRLIQFWSLRSWHLHSL